MNRPSPERVEVARRAIAGSRWRLLLHDPAPGDWNMAVDEALLDAVAAGRSGPTLRFYGWDPPSLSLGRFQRAEAGIDLSVCRRRGWGIVRRPTGGRAVLHADEITFAIVVPLERVANVGVLTSYCLFSSAMNEAIAALHPGLAPGAGCDTPARDAPASCFATTTAADGRVGERKLVGAAQVRRGGALLQHGSLLCRVDRDAMRELFGSEGNCVGLAELLPTLPSRAVLCERVAAGFGEALGIVLERGELSEEERDDLCRRPLDSSESP